MPTPTYKQASPVVWAPLSALQVTKEDVMRGMQLHIPASAALAIEDIMPMGFVEDAVATYRFAVLYRQTTTSRVVVTMFDFNHSAVQQLAADGVRAGSDTALYEGERSNQ